MDWTSRITIIAAFFNPKITLSCIIVYVTSIYKHLGIKYGGFLPKQRNKSSNFVLRSLSLNVKIFRCCHVSKPR